MPGKKVSVATSNALWTVTVPCLLDLQRNERTDQQAIDVSALQESLAAADIHPGSHASAQDFIAAIKQGCGVEPQLACHYRTADLQEVSCCVAYLQTINFVSFSSHILSIWTHTRIPFTAIHLMPITTHALYTTFVYLWLPAAFSWSMRSVTDGGVRSITCKPSVLATCIRNVNSVGKSHYTFMLKMHHAANDIAPLHAVTCQECH